MCPSGSYCPFNTSTPIDCPLGSYCPQGTRFSTEYLCPVGTFANATNLAAPQNCTACTAGKYCSTTGLTQPTGTCSAGYFCGGGASSATPYDSGAHSVTYVGETCASIINGTLNDICPPGHYCPIGSVAPIQCPPGTNSSSLGLQEISDCPLCTRGFYCPVNGTILATRKCLEGFFCPGGVAQLGNGSINLLCPVGSHCPAGSGQPVLCDAGTYQNEIGQSRCKVRSELLIHVD